MSVPFLSSDLITKIEWKESFFGEKYFIGNRNQILLEINNGLSYRLKRLFFSYHFWQSFYFQSFFTRLLSTGSHFTLEFQSQNTDFNGKPMNQFTGTTLHKNSMNFIKTLLNGIAICAWSLWAISKILSDLLVELWPNKHGE